jgi:hypothetical protein
MSEQETWVQRMAVVRPLFELAGFGLTAVTWSSLSFVVSYLVVRGYWTPSPALDSMGTSGTILYVGFAAVFVTIAVVTSGTLALAFWALIVSSKRDLESSESRVVAFIASAFGGWLLWASAIYLFVVGTVLVIQILRAIGPATSN